MLNLSQRDAKGHKLILGRDNPVSPSPRLKITPHFIPFPADTTTFYTGHRSQTYFAVSFF